MKPTGKISTGALDSLLSLFRNNSNQEANLTIMVVTNNEILEGGRAGRNRQLEPSDGWQDCLGLIGSLGGKARKRLTHAMMAARRSEPSKRKTPVRWCGRGSFLYSFGGGLNDG